MRAGRAAEMSAAHLLSLLAPPVFLAGPLTDQRLPFPVKATFLRLREISGPTQLFPGPRVEYVRCSATLDVVGT